MKFLITESKIKQFIKKKFGVDLTDRIKIIQSYYDLPKHFQRMISKDILNMHLNNHGPMYVFYGDTDSFLYQNQNGIELIGDSTDHTVSYSDLMEDLGIEDMGLTIQQVIDIYVNED